MNYTEETTRLQARYLNSIKVIRREVFHVKNKEHLQSFKQYLETGTWGDVQFFAEGEHITVPETVMRKYSKSMLNKALK